MVMDTNSPTSESVFNMAFAYLNRVHNLLNECTSSALRQDTATWLTLLRCIQREVSIKITEEDYNKLDEEFKIINTIPPSDKQQLLIKLHLLEVKMRRIMQKRGMLLPSKDDPRYAVLRR